jgi:tRNA pseudouridine13 synthase
MNSAPSVIYPAAVNEASSGRIKQRPQDFKVVEQLGFELTGSGEHLFLYLQKTGLTTHQLIERIARQLDVSPRQIGYSGLKDKHAVTQQWISVQLPGCRQVPDIEQADDLQLLQSGWHDKKLRIGSHRSNSFEITVREVTADADRLSAQLLAIKAQGFANYFGEQRFGSAQDNVAQALRVLNNRHKSKRLSRQKRSLYLSALRSELFNRIVSQRVGQGIWQQPLDGDVFMLAGTQSVFSEPLDETLRKRYQQFDIHSGISLFGEGESRQSGEALALEQAVLSEYDDIAQTLLNARVKRAYRANRAVAHHLQIDFDADSAVLKLRVDLQKGVYLTTLLSHFLNINASSP